MTNAEKQAIVENALKHQEGRQKLGDFGAEVIKELHDKLRADGWTEAEIQHLHAFMVSRRPITNYTEIARSLFPVEPMPTGAIPIYCHDPAKEEP
jgi:hypothetical protein